MNYRDCNYSVSPIGENVIIDCFTKEQVLNNIHHPYGCLVYRMNHETRKAELIGRIKGDKEND